MRKELIIALSSAVLGIILWWWLFPSPVPIPVVPAIITKFDTVQTVKLDTIFKPIKVHTTDTVNLIISQTIVDTEFINVNAPAEERRNVWPMLQYHGSARWGDTATISTFSLRSGQLGISRVFQAGILTAIDTDSTATPRLSFTPFPPKGRVSLIQKISYGLVGYGACSLVNLVRP